MRNKPVVKSFQCVLAALGLIVAAGATAYAQEPAATTTPQAQRMIDAFSAWMQRTGVPNGSLAVMSGKKLAGKYGAGTYAPNKPEMVASLSKAITAMCIARLVDAGQINFTTKLGNVLADYLAANPPKDKQVRQIRISDLLTHSSGINYDPSQGDQGGAIEKLPHDQTNLGAQLTITFKKRLGTGIGTTYFYNNMNYAILGYIVETLTGRAYEEYCYETVLQPAGVTPTGLDPHWRVLSSYAAWKISAVNYARFLAYFLPSRHLLQTGPHQWPRFGIGDGASYTLGALMRRNGTEHNFWHSGSWRWNNTNLASYYTVIGEDVRYAAEFSPTVDDAAFSDLDSSIYTAAVGGEAAAAAGRPLPASLLPR